MTRYKLGVHDYTLTADEGQFIQDAIDNIYASPTKRKGRTYQQVANHCKWMILEPIFARINGLTWIGDLGDPDAWSREHWDCQDPETGEGIDIKKIDEWGFLTVRPKNIEHTYKNLDKIRWLVAGEMIRLEGRTYRAKFHLTVDAHEAFSKTPWNPRRPSYPREAGYLDRKYWYTSRNNDARWFFDHRLEDSKLISRRYDQ